MSGFDGEPLERRLGRFWAISPESDEESTGSDDECDAASSPAVCDSPETDRSIAYLCETPVAVPCDLQEMSSKALLRKEKKKKKRQRSMAVVLQGMNSTSFSLDYGKVSADRRILKIKEPVLSPSTFFLDSFDAAEWITVQRRKRKVKISNFYHSDRKMNLSQCASTVHRFCKRISNRHELGVGRAGCTNPFVKAPLIPMKGYMGLEPGAGRSLQRNLPSRGTDGTRRLLGFAGNRSSKKAPFLWPGGSAARYTTTGVVGDVMNNGGGYNSNRGRGQGGGAGRGTGGGGRWNSGGGFGSGRGNNYYEGSSSGTAGDDGGSGNGLDQQGGRFDGVFRAGRNTNDGGRGRFNSGYGFDRGSNRRNFNGQGNFNNRRFSNGYSGRDGNGRGIYVPRESSNVSNSEGLTAAQALLVKEAAAAFAKQIAGLQQMGAQPGSTQMQSGIPTTGMPVVNSTSSSMRPEATLLAVAGLSAPPVPAVASPREASGDVPLAKKKKASTCFRCDQPGHCLNDCNAVICDCCQDPQHATRDCPLLLAPKPTMVMYGLAHEELMFWDTPLSQSVRPRLENTRMGRVTISGGQMTVEEIITQLRWIVPEENYHWEVVQMEENVYRVNFPSKIDLVRVQHFGRFNVPSSEIFMTFDFWTRNVQPAWRAEDVWVRVYDLPSPALDDFLALWAIGTLFGKTRDIDMTFTRANDVLRICITCLDPTLIPAQMDVRVQDDFFRLRFEVEGLQPYVPQDTTMADAPNGDGDMEHDGHTDDSVPDVTKDTAPDEQANNTNNSNGQKDTFMPPGQRNLNLTPIQFGSYGSGIINKSTQSGRMIEQVDVLDGAKELQYVLSEVADDRMSDKALDCADPADNHGAVKAQPIMHGVAMAHPIMHGATSIGGANAPIQHKIHGTPTTNGARALPYSSISTSTGGTHDAVPGAAVRSAGVAHVITPSILTSTNDMSKVMGVSPTNKPSMEEVISFGGISRGSDMGLRSSDRIRRQPNADATQMERAMDLAQRRDDTSGQGYSQSYTLDSTMGVPAPGGPAGGYGYWMQPFANGYSGLLFPGYWVASY